MLYSIEQIRDTVVPIAQRYGVAKVSLFGSYSRGEQKDQSDLDFLIDKGQLKNLLSYFSFVSDLEDAFQKHVDVVTSTANDADFLHQIRKDEVILYERQRSADS